MKNRPSSIAFPTTEQDVVLWGFDVLKPVGTPKAWIHEWQGVQPGWNKPMRGIMDLIALVSEVGTGMSRLKIDDVIAALGFMYKKDIFDLIEGVENAVDRDTAMKIVREYGIKAGSLGWTSSQGQYGSPLPLEKIALYQDFVHTLYGPNMQPNTWFDDEKVVCSRTDCTFSPSADKREMAAYCRQLCGGMTDGYMQCEPTLLTARLIDIGADGSGHRCVHLWTYRPEVFQKIDDTHIANIPDTTRQLLSDRSVKI